MANLEIDRPVPSVLRITLNRPDSLNAFTWAMYEELISLLEQTAYQPDVRVVIMTGAGKAFCAGHDLRDGGEAPWVAPNQGKAQSTFAVLNKLGRIAPLMRSMPQPIIAAVNGSAAGVGYAIALAADLCIAGQSAKFVNAFHNSGTGHEIGFSYLLTRAVGSQNAAELMLTGKRVPAEEAARIGLILRAVEDDQLQTEALALAESILENSPIGVALTKRTMWINQAAPSLEAAIELESRAIFMSQTTDDTAEKRRAFFEKRKPDYTGR